MEQLLNTIFNSGITLPSILMLIQFIIVFYISIYIKNKITNFANYRKVCANKNISIGTTLKLAVNNTTLNAQIKKISSNFIILKSDNIDIIIPITEFASMTLIIIKG
jgi:hypothetical protein